MARSRAIVAAVVLVVGMLATGGVATSIAAPLDEGLRARLARLSRAEPRARVRVTVDQAYDYAPLGSRETRSLAGLRLPFARVAGDLLRAAGLAVVAGEAGGETAATLEIHARGRAFARRYAATKGAELYVGATLAGEIVYRVPGFAPWRTPFAGRVSPPLELAVNLGYERPENAPFARAFALYASFLPRILQVVGAAHGPRALIAALDADDAATRRTAARVLGELGDAAAVGPLIALLDGGGDDDELRRQAAWALGRLGDAAAVEPLRRALDDRSRDVRWFAAWALAQITGAPIDETLATRRSRRRW